MTGAATHHAPSLLDAPFWSALTTHQASFAVGSGSGSVLRYQPDVAAFAAFDPAAPVDAGGWDALAEVVPAGDLVIVAWATDLPDPPPGWVTTFSRDGHQMVLIDPDRLEAGAGAGTGVDAEGPIRPLTTDDVAAMLALVELTQPGPFRPRTIELGAYVGVVEDGQLIAMAGERGHIPGFTEVSAVCTHPDARGRGLAAALTRRVVAGILARDETPYLHVADGNDSARLLYERLGFEVRRSFTFAAHQRAAHAPAVSAEPDRW